MKHNSILIMFHCSQHTGYAIESLEDVFLQAAKKAGYREESIHWSYHQILEPMPRTYKISYNSITDANNLKSLIKKNNIKTILAFDLPYPTRVAKAAKNADVEKIISYWGASMSSLNRGPKLWIKKVEWFFRRNQAPDLFIFESESMKKTATHGRGVPVKNTAVVHLGVDLQKFKPSKNNHYAHQVFNIPKHRKIVFYSGHMEERKGVRVIINAAISLFDQHKILDLHFLICGNQNNEAEQYLKLLANTRAAEFVTFAGYRSDIPQLLKSSYIGVIASTGWDSFTMSSLEMLASGLPLIVSELQGLSETIEAGVSGEFIKPGNHNELAEKIITLISDEKKHSYYAIMARKRAKTHFSKESQIIKLSNYLQSKALQKN